MLYTHIPDISCFYSDSISDHLLLPAAHFEYEMILVTSGRAVVTINQKVYHLSAPSLVFISRLERHTFQIQEEPYCRYVVSLSGDLILSQINVPKLISIFMLRPQDFSHVIALEEKTCEALLPLFIEMTQEYALQQDLYLPKSTALVLFILIELYRSAPSCFPIQGHSAISETVINAQRYISDHFNRKLTLQEIADANYISRHALSLGFKEVVGITFKEYLLLFRLTEAKKLLTATTMSVAQIGEAVGYVNVNNFLKIFKEKEHVTPLQYRKQYPQKQQESMSLL